MFSKTCLHCVLKYRKSSLPFVMEYPVKVSFFYVVN